MRILAIVKRIANQFKRDKRTLALMFIAPLLLITLLNFLFDSDSVNPKVGEYGLTDSMITQLEKSDLSIKKYANNTNPKDKIEKNDLDAFIDFSDNQLTITYENSDPSKSKQIALKVQSALLKEQQANLKNAAKQLEGTMKQMQASGNANESAVSIPKGEPNIQVETHYVYGDKDTTFFDTIGPIFIGFFVFFFVFLIAGISFLRERTTGTLERLMATPIKRIEIELGYMIGFGIFALLQSVLVAVYSVQVLDMIQNGSIWYVLLITLMLAMVSLALGMLLSTFANNEFQIIQFIPIVIVPQILFCGIFPLEGMADWLQWIAHIMPMYYGAQALQSIMIKGEGFSSFAGDFYILLLFIAAFLILNIFALKKYRKV